MNSKHFSKLSIILDNRESWFWEYVELVKKTLSLFSETVRIYKNAREVEDGDILFILSCDSILKNDVLIKNSHNIVVHASHLPNGKGWSPVSWQVEQGCNAIPVTLFEASELLDSGDWYLRDVVHLEGHELIDEIRYALFETILSMIRRFLAEYPLKRHKQVGEDSFYPRRVTKNQELDIEKSIKDQFNLLRVCDNERYPAHFLFKGRKYILKIIASNDSRD